jgi:hypothetical protein
LDPIATQQLGFQVIFEVPVLLCMRLAFCQGLEGIARPLSMSITLMLMVE